MANKINNSRVKRAALKMINSGADKKAVAKEFGTTVQTLNRWIKELEHRKEELEHRNYTSSEIVEHICKIAECDDYVDAFNKLNVPTEGFKLSNGTMLLF